MSFDLLMAILGALSPRPSKPRRPRVPRDIVHVTAPEQLGKRAKRRARGKRKGGT